MEDLAGIGRATEKFLEIVRSSIGTLYRPGAIRNEGEARARAEAYRMIELAKADVEVRQIEQNGEEALAQRAISRLRHQEMNKQKNIETIIDQTVPKIEREAIEDSIDKDWLSHFFESCANVSEEKIQSLWSDVLASKLTGENLARKIVDCLRWMDPEIARHFSEFAQVLFLFHGAFSLIVQRLDDAKLSLSFGYDTDALVDIGLIKENLNTRFDFSFASLRLSCRELTDRSLQHRGVFEFTQTGSRLARVIVPTIKKCMTEVNRRDVAHDSEDRLALESEILSHDERVRIACGGILGFLIERDAEISISKAIIRIEGKEHFHDAKEVMSISTSGGKLVIKQNKRGRHWKETLTLERSSLEHLAAFLKRELQLVERRPPPR